MCGNFGLLLLLPAHRRATLRLLRKMLRITMIRGAQSAGIATYDRSGVGLRCRVVNGKRTDLEDVLFKRFSRSYADMTCGLFQGHTRFATSSVCNIAGCHPHQWLPRSKQMAWRLATNPAYRFVCERRSVESFITHNGDCDAFTIHGNKYAIADLQLLLVRLLGHPIPSDVDSACVAGLLDMLRTKGVWLASVRYGYLFGALSTAGSLHGRSHELASAAQLEQLADAFETQWQALVASNEELTAASQCTRASSGAADAASTECVLLEAVGKRMVERMQERFASAPLAGMLPLLQAELSPGSGRQHTGEAQRQQAAAVRLIECAVSAFLFGDLLRAALELLRGADGSFGLVLSSSLDAGREVVVAARGQTMSLAFYPRRGLVAFGSEATATKVPMQEDVVGGADQPAQPAYRYDLDDVRGETVLLRWDEPPPPQPSPSPPWQTARICCAGEPRTAVEAFRYDPASVSAPAGAAAAASLDPEAGSSSSTARSLFVVNVLDRGADGGGGGEDALPPMWRGRLALNANPLLSPPPPLVEKDPVGADLRAIPAVLSRLNADFDTEQPSPNRVAAWTLTSQLRRRLRMHRDGAHDGSVDVLITGCEVSLWVGEQFASDLQLLYPKLSIVVLSSNKLLGQLGNAMPIPQLGHRFNERSHDFRGTVGLVLTHSGSTFAPLACCSLLKGYTEMLFVVTSDLDTQAAAVVRTSGASASAKARNSLGSSAPPFLDLESQFVFTTHAGFRSAEPCSVSLVAMHHLLTKLLIFAMGYLAHSEHQRRLADDGGDYDHVSICGSSFTFEEARELATLSRQQPAAIAEIVGTTQTSAALRRQGKVWAQHVARHPDRRPFPPAPPRPTPTHSQALTHTHPPHGTALLPPPPPTQLEGPIAWVLSVVYIAATVIAGVTPLSALCNHATGNGSPAAVYVVAIADVAIYAFLAWWTTVVLRLLQGRPLLHRVAGRSVLIGDVPWVSQAAEAFASKLFALSYSIASCSFAAANPADHLVHRHTHRVVRGSLLAIGRPDGRVNALTTAEAACVLSVNQASSIQNLGVTCESVTLGHNPFELPLSAKHLVLPTHRPRFMCEVMREVDGVASPASSRACSVPPTPSTSVHGGCAMALNADGHAGRHRNSRDASLHGGCARSRDASSHGGSRDASSHGNSWLTSWLSQPSVEGYVPRQTLLGQLTLGGDLPAERPRTAAVSLSEAACAALAASSSASNRQLAPLSERASVSMDGRAKLRSLVERVHADVRRRRRSLRSHGLEELSIGRNTHSSGGADCAPSVMKATFTQVGRRSRKHFERAAGRRDAFPLARTSFTVEPLAEPYLGAWMVRRPDLATLGVDELMRRQQLVQVLSETRFDALQRLCAFFVLFHEMGKTVADWWPRHSLGLLGYDMSRSQSIMRVATTASPVSGMEVRERMLAIRLHTQRAHAATRIQRALRLKRCVQAKARVAL